MSGGKGMKIFKTVLCLLFATGLSVCYAGELTGLAIAEKVHDSNKSRVGLVIQGSMKMKDLRSGSEEKRDVITLALTRKDITKSLFRFTSSTYKGTTFLTVERKKRDNLQYLYLNSVGSPRQIESSDKEKSFVDTDMSNEDMGGAKIRDYTYKRLGDKTIRGRQCYLIERYPKSRSSKYTKHIVVIDKQTMIPVRVKSYGKSGRVIRTMAADDIKPVAKNINIPRKIRVIDLVKKHETEMNINMAKQKKINRGYFNKNRMSRRWVEEK